MDKRYSSDNIFDAYDNIPPIYKKIGELNAYAYHHLRTGNYREAINYANQVLAIDPDDRNAKYYLASAEKALGISGGHAQENRPTQTSSYTSSNTTQADWSFLDRVPKDAGSNVQKLIDAARANSLAQETAKDGGNARKDGPVKCSVCRSKITDKYNVYHDYEGNVICDVCHAFRRTH